MAMEVGEIIQNLRFELQVSGYEKVESLGTKIDSIKTKFEGAGTAGASLNRTLEAGGPAGTAFANSAASMADSLSRSTRAIRDQVGVQQEAVTASQASQSRMRAEAELRSLLTQRAEAQARAFEAIQLAYRTHAAGANELVKSEQASVAAIDRKIVELQKLAAAEREAATASTSKIAKQPAWLTQQIDTRYAAMQARGLAGQIEEMSAQRLTATQISKQLGVENIDVRATRAKLGIPSMDMISEFDAWLTKYKAGIRSIQEGSGQATSANLEISKSEVSTTAAIDLHAAALQRLASVEREAATGGIRATSVGAAAAKGGGLLPPSGSPPGGGGPPGGPPPGGGGPPNFPVPPEDAIAKYALLQKMVQGNTAAFYEFVETGGATTATFANMSRAKQRDAEAMLQMTEARVKDITVTREQELASKKLNEQELISIDLMTLMERAANGEMAAVNALRNARFKDQAGMEAMTKSQRESIAALEQMTRDRVKLTSVQSEALASATGIKAPAPVIPPLTGFAKTKAQIAELDELALQGLDMVSAKMVAYNRRNLTGSAEEKVALDEIHTKLMAISNANAEIGGRLAGERVHVDEIRRGLSMLNKLYSEASERTAIVAANVEKAAKYSKEGFGAIGGAAAAGGYSQIGPAFRPIAPPVLTGSLPGMKELQADTKAWEKSMLEAQAEVIARAEAFNDVRLIGSKEEKMAIEQLVAAQREVIAAHDAVGNTLMTERTREQEINDTILVANKLINEQIVKWNEVARLRQSGVATGITTTAEERALRAGAGIPPPPPKPPSFPPTPPIPPINNAATAMNKLGMATAEVDKLFVVLSETTTKAFKKTETGGLGMRFQLAALLEQTVRAKTALSQFGNVMTSTGQTTKEIFDNAIKAQVELTRVYNQTMIQMVGVQLRLKIATMFSIAALEQMAIKLITMFAPLAAMMAAFGAIHKLVTMVKDTVAEIGIRADLAASIKALAPDSEAATKALDHFEESARKTRFTSGELAKVYLEMLPNAFRTFRTADPAKPLLNLVDVLAAAATVWRVDVKTMSDAWTQLTEGGARKDNKLLQAVHMTVAEFHSLGGQALNEVMRRLANDFPAAAEKAGQSLESARKLIGGEWTTAMAKGFEEAAGGAESMGTALHRALTDPAVLAAFTEIGKAIQSFTSLMPEAAKGFSSFMQSVAEHMKAGDIGGAIADAIINGIVKGIELAIKKLPVFVIKVSFSIVKGVTGALTEFVEPDAKNLSAWIKKLNLDDEGRKIGRFADDASGSWGRVDESVAGASKSLGDVNKAAEGAATSAVGAAASASKLISDIEDKSFTETETVNVNAKRALDDFTKSVDERYNHIIKLQQIQQQFQVKPYSAGTDVMAMGEDVEAYQRKYVEGVTQIDKELIKAGRTLADFTGKNKDVFGATPEEISTLVRSIAHWKEQKAAMEDVYETGMRLKKAYGDLAIAENARAAKARIAQEFMLPKSEQFSAAEREIEAVGDKATALVAKISYDISNLQIKLMLDKNTPAQVEMINKKLDELRSEIVQTEEASAKLKDALIQVHIEKMWQDAETAAISYQKKQDDLVHSLHEIFYQLPRALATPFIMEVARLEEWRNQLIRQVQSQIIVPGEPGGTFTEAQAGTQIKQINEYIDQLEKRVPDVARVMARAFTDNVQQPLVDMFSELAITGGKNFSEVIQRDFARIVSDAAKLLVAKGLNVLFSALTGKQTGFSGQGREGTPLSPEMLDTIAKGVARTNFIAGAAVQAVTGAASGYTSQQSDLTVAIGGLTAAIGIYTSYLAAVETGLLAAGPYGWVAAAVVAVGTYLGKLLQPSPGSQYPYGRFYVSPTGGAKFTGTQNIDTAQAEQVTAQYQSVIDAFMTGYLGIAAKLGVSIKNLAAIYESLIPKIGKLEEGAALGPDASEKFFEHVQEYLTNTLPKQIAEKFKLTLQKGFENIGVTASKFTEVWAKLQKLDPKMAMQALLDWADALNLIHETLFGGKQGFGLPPGMAMPVEATYQYLVGRETTSPADLLGEADRAIIKAGEDLKDLPIEAQIAGQKQIADMMKQRYQQEIDALKKIMQVAQQIKDQATAALEKYETAKFTKGGVTDYSGLISYYTTKYNSDVAALAAAKTPEEVAKAFAAVQADIDKLYELGQNFDEATAESYRQWAIAATNYATQLANSILDSIKGGIQTANDRFLAQFQPIFDSFTTTIDDTNTNLVSLSQAAKNAADALNQIVDRSRQHSTTPTTAAQSATTTPSHSAASTAGAHTTAATSAAESPAVAASARTAPPPETTATVPATTQVAALEALVSRFMTLTGGMTDTLLKSVNAVADTLSAAQLKLITFVDSIGAADAALKTLALLAAKPVPSEARREVTTITRPTSVTNVTNNVTSGEEVLVYLAELQASQQAKDDELISVLQELERNGIAVDILTTDPGGYVRDVRVRRMQALRSLGS